MRLSLIPIVGPKVVDNYPTVGLIGWLIKVVNEKLDSEHDREVHIRDTENKEPKTLGRSARF